MPACPQPLQHRPLELLPRLAAPPAALRPAAAGAPAAAAPPLVACSRRRLLVDTPAHLRQGAAPASVRVQPDQRRHLARPEPQHRRSYCLGKTRAVSCSTCSYRLLLVFLYWYIYEKMSYSLRGVVENYQMGIQANGSRISGFSDIYKRKSDSPQLQKTDLIEFVRDVLNVVINIVNHRRRQPILDILIRDSQEHVCVSHLKSYEVTSEKPLLTRTAHYLTKASIADKFKFTYLDQLYYTVTAMLCVQRQIQEWGGFDRHHSFIPWYASLQHALSELPAGRDT